MNKEELKNQIITLLKDLFSFNFRYDERTNRFISDIYNDYDECANIYVDKEGIDLNIGHRDGDGYCYVNYIDIDELIKLTKYLKEFYK